MSVLMAIKLEKLLNEFNAEGVDVTVGVLSAIPGGRYVVFRVNGEEQNLYKVISNYRSQVEELLSKMAGSVSKKLTDYL